MKESVTYQAIIEEGRVEAIREALLHLAVRKLGKPDRKTAKSISIISDYEQLLRLHDRVQDVDSWQELLSE